MKKKGFTLIELLAVIVILAIIAIIAIPVILNVIEIAKEGAFKDSVNGIVDATEKKIALDMVDGKTVANTYTFVNGKEAANELSKYIKGEKPDSAKIKVDNNRNITFAMWDKDTNLCAYKSKAKGEIKYKSNVKTGNECNELAFEGVVLNKDLFTHLNYSYIGDSATENVDAILFVDYIDTSNAALGYESGNEYPLVWDISPNHDGSVMQWVEVSTDNPSPYTQYKMYIGSEKIMYAPEDSSYMFDCIFQNVTKAYFYNFDTSKVKNMSYMFHYCDGLTSLDLSGFDTSNVTDMSYMFNECYSLESINLSSFDTSKVTNMEAMFNSCESLTTLDVSSFDTRNVTNMNSMFYICKSLTSLDVSSFDTRNVTDMSSMFCSCIGLTTLDVSSFDTRNATDMSVMFAWNGNLTTVYVGPNWIINSGTDTSSMFLNSGTNTTTLKS